MTITYIIRHLINMLNRFRFNLILYYKLVFVENDYSCSAVYSIYVIKCLLKIEVITCVNLN